MRNDIKALTGLRGVAALYVVFYHFTFEGCLGPHAVRRLLGHGYLAVDLFFILSGFVMALTHARDFGAGLNAGAYREFIGRRIARIYPLYFVLTLVCVLVAWAGCNHKWAGWRPELLQLGINGSLMQALHGGLSIDLPAWSISTEMIAYLVFPLLCAATLTTGRRRAAAVAALCVFTLAVLSLIPSDWLPPNQRTARLAWMDLSDGRTFYPVFRCLADFTMGLLVWRLWTGKAGQWLARHPWTGDAASLCVLAALFLRNDDTVTVVLFAPLILCLAACNSFTTRALASRLPETLGVVSYSIYLVHQPVRDILETALNRMPGSLPGGRLPVTAAEAAIVVGVACGTYWLVEKPGREALSRALARTWRQPAGNARAGKPGHWRASTP